MYIPKQYQNHNMDEIKDFIQQNSFGILVTNNNKISATHIPLELSADGTKLEGHIAKANPQWKNFSPGQDVLAIFNGPHTYISSSWYDHENVPTWNYIAVHIYGTIEIVEGERLYQALKRLLDKYEKHSAHPVSMETMSPAYLEKEMRGLVGFEITITNIEAAYKLSQNRDAKNHQAIIEQLEKRNDPHSSAIAESMRKTKR